MDAARLLEEKCREFSVEGQVVQIHPGPVVTTYEFKPDAGVKYSRITGLADDLCLAMQAESVLIDRIPGKSTVGIQIPNPHREAHRAARAARVRASTRARRRSSRMALGKTIHGEPFVSDLATMPHLLIAGSTGAGKSVSVNAMISSILFRATPDDVRFIMIDPKRLELGMYEDIPHLLTPVVVDPKQAANALRWAVREMEERYKTLAAHGVRNIEQFNRNVRARCSRKTRRPKDPKGNELKTLPYIIVIIDELADLMMVAGKEVEESIARLAQMARAVGIHLILATQRPSVDVITGLIKANLPARIAFRVASKIDSRTILDGNGAEQLLGKGDMLYLPPASSRFVRIHGPYISEQETARLCSFLRKQGKPIYDTTITAEEKPAEKDRVREGRSLRRGRAHRRLERPGVDFVSAAAAAHRLQPRGAAHRHDGNGRRRLAGRRRQARSARRPALLRGSGRSTEVGHAAMTRRHPLRFLIAAPLAAAVLLCLGRAAARRPPDAADLYASALAREQAARNAALGVGGRPSRDREGLRRHRRAISDERLRGQRALAGGRSLRIRLHPQHDAADRRRAQHDLQWLQAASIASSPFAKQVDGALAKLAAPDATPAGTSRELAGVGLTSSIPVARSARRASSAVPDPVLPPPSGPAAFVKSITESAAAARRADHDRAQPARSRSPAIASIARTACSSTSRTSTIARVGRRQGARDQRRAHQVAARRPRTEWA